MPQHQHVSESGHTNTGDSGQHYRDKKGGPQPPITAYGEKQSANPQQPVTRFPERHQTMESKQSDRRTNDAWGVQEEDIETDEAQTQRHHSIREKKDDPQQKANVHHRGTMVPVFLRTDNQV